MNCEAIEQLPTLLSGLSGTVQLWHAASMYTCLLQCARTLDKCVSLLRNAGNQESAWESICAYTQYLLFNIHVAQVDR